MEIYEETYEAIAFKIKKHDEEEAEKAPKTVIPENVDDDDALDMFMDAAKNREEKPEEAKKEEEEEAKPISLDDEVI